MSNFTSNIPVVGMGKSAYHFMNGDAEKGGEVLYQCSRSASVAVGSAAGNACGGLPGAAGGAIIGGLVVDSAASIITGKPKGYVEGIVDVCEDLSNGNFPVDGAMKIGITAAKDATTGVLIGSGIQLYSELNSITAFDKMSKTNYNSLMAPFLARATVEAFTATAEARSERPSKERGNNKAGSKSKQATNSTKTSNDSSRKAKNSFASSNGAEEPEDNRNNRINGGQHYAASRHIDFHMKIFLRIFNAQSLDDIAMGNPGINIFYGLADGQIKTLKKLVKNLISDGYLEIVIEVVSHLFDCVLYTDDITFPNFLSLVNFVVTYIGEYISKKVQENGNGSYENRRQEEIDFIMRNGHRFAEEIRDYFCFIKFDIAAENDAMSTPFRDIYSAAYHYFKHRHRPDSGSLQIDEYFNLIRTQLNLLKRLCVYRDLFDENNPRQVLVYDIFFSRINRRFRIVLKVQDGNVELSSGYFLDSFMRGDEEGDVFVDKRRIIERDRFTFRCCCSRCRWDKFFPP